MLGINGRAISIKKVLSTLAKHTSLLPKLMKSRCFNADTNCNKLTGVSSIKINKHATTDPEPGGKCWASLAGLFQ
jgi:hypothetical protein